MKICAVNWKNKYHSRWCLMSDAVTIKHFSLLWHNLEHIENTRLKCPSLRLCIDGYFISHSLTDTGRSWWWLRILSKYSFYFMGIKRTTQNHSLHYIYYIVKSTIPFIYIYTLYSCNFLFKQESAPDIWKRESRTTTEHTAYKMSESHGCLVLVAL